MASCGSVPGRWAATRSEAGASLDRWLGGLLGHEPGVALVALGSFGRGDAAPHSDLDLLLLHAGRRDVGAVADRLWYPIWDRGIGLDHSVRTLREALRLAEGDLTVAQGLLDARLVAGDAALVEELLARIRELWRTKAKRFLPALRDAVVARQRRFGEVAFLLEPEVKDGRGGLRDVHALRAAAVATPVLDGRLGPVDGPHDVLAAVRAALHRRAGKRLDRLLLQEQDGVARDLGLADADALMAEVSAAARTIAWVSDDAWGRIDSWLAGPSGRRADRDLPVGADLVLREGEVVVSPSPSSPTWWLDAAVAAAATGAPLARATLERMADTVGGPPEPWPDATRDQLVALLGAGDRAIPVLEALDQHDLLTRLLPEWARVRHRPQRNAYHRFTVDRHLCEAAARAAALTRSVSRPDLLLLAAWLHDIGKGYPGDHTAAGVEAVAVIGSRMGLPPADVATLVTLVRHHLLLADLATRRDLDDPATVERVAAAVGDVETLDLLAALTEADSLATGPTAWSDWKAGLVRELVRRARAFLTSGRRPAVVEPAPVEVPAAPDGLRGEGLRCTVVAADRRGLFSLVAGVLAVHGLDVRSATASPTTDGRAVETFEVEPSFGCEPDWDGVAADLAAALDGRFPLEERLSARASTYASRYRRPAPAPTRVLVDNEASARSTVVEVRTADGVGVLHRITAALATCGLDIRSARATTLGHEVIDTFYVSGEAGKVRDPDRLRAVEAAVVAALDGDR